MITLIRLLPGLLIFVSMTVNAAAAVTKCIDENGKITFSTMGCKSSEVDTNAVEEAKARAEAEAKAQAQAQEEADRRKRAIDNIGAPSATATNDSAASGKETNSTATSKSTTDTDTTTKTESGNKSGTRGSINGDLTTGYQ